MPYVYGYSRSLKECATYSEAGFKGSYELLDLSAGNLTQVFTKNKKYSSLLSHLSDFIV